MTTIGQSRNAERKRIGHLTHTTADMAIAQKKFNTRETANKTSGARGIQLNQKDIVFSKSMNLS